jgi:hypothetical protein
MDATNDLRRVVACLDARRDGRMLE